ncbi:MAG: protein kinase domain-containing protein, partial [Halanaerobiales bacterium]
DSMGTKAEKYSETTIIKVKRKIDSKTAIAKYISFIESEESDKFHNYKSQVNLFMQEPKILKKLGKHDYIIELYDSYIDYFQEPPELLFVMEKAEGIDLNKYMKDYSPITDKTFYLFMQKFIEAVSHIHNNGIVHRDLSSNNIFIKNGPKGEIEDLKIIDFGMAYLRGQGIRQKAGTAFYAPPESFTKISKRPKSTYDMYSVGIIMYQLLSGGKIPYQSTLSSIADESSYRSLKRDDIPVAIENFIKKCLKYKTKDRPYSIVQIKSEIYKGLRRLVKDGSY